MELKDLLQLDAGGAIDWIIDNWDEYELKRKQQLEKPQVSPSNSSDLLCGNPTDAQLLNWGDMKVEKIELVGLGWSVDGAPKENTLRKALMAAMQKDNAA